MEVIADYNKDFYAWLMKNADLLRQHKFNFEQLLKKDFLPEDENNM